MTARIVRLDMVRTRPPFSTLNPIEPDIREAIAADMRANGFDGNAPISVWPEADGLTVVDGHTRLEAAVAAGLSEIAIFEHDFADEDTAYDYAVHNQRDRRNLSSEAKYNLIMQADARYRSRARGGTGANRYTKSTELSSDSSVDSVPSAVKTAAHVGVGESTVYRARAVAADPVALDALKSGKSISAAAKIAYERNRDTPRKRESRRSQSPASNGRTPPSRDDEPWFRARSVGSIAASKILVVIKDIQRELDRLKAQGIEIADHMDNRHVSREWSGKAKDGALKRANELQRLIRQSISPITDDESG